MILSLSALLLLVAAQPSYGQMNGRAAPFVGPDIPPAAPHLGPAFTRAVVEMVPGNFNVTGALLLIESATGLFVTGLLFGLQPGPHAMHVHEYGQLGNRCAAAGGHFNPDNTTGHEHGPVPGAAVPAGHAGHGGGAAATPGRHAGDLGYVMTPVRGPTLVYRYDEKLRLGGRGRYDVAGLAIIVHENVAGEPRAACGIIRCLNC